MQVNADDQWLLLYMVHSEVVQPKEVWITYDIDFVATEDAEELGLAPAKPIWLDVQSDRSQRERPTPRATRCSTCRRASASTSKDYGQKVCTWPAQNCARHDMYGNVTPQQGKPNAQRPRRRLEGPEGHGRHHRRRWAVTCIRAGSATR